MPAGATTGWNRPSGAGVSGVENATLSALVFVESEDGEPLRIELSGDEGLTWIDAGEVGNTEGWEMVRFTLADMLGAVPSVRVRFTIADSGASSTVEAGVGSYAIGWGCVFADFDADSYEDLFVVNMNAPNRLYTHGGSFPCVDRASEWNVAGSSVSFAVAVADVEQDTSVSAGGNCSRTRQPSPGAAASARPSSALTIAPPFSAITAG